VAESAQAALEFRFHVTVIDDHTRECLGDMV
jgi:hypothetical protein